MNGEAPLNAVCVVRREGTPYVVVGGYDRNLFVLSAAGTLVQRVPSEAYSRERAWGKGGDKPVPPNRRHSINFLRRIRREDGSDTLAVHGVVNSLAARGSIYLFEPLEERPFAILPLPEGDPVGAFRVVDADGDGQEDILLGTSGMGEEASVDRLGVEPDYECGLVLITPPQQGLYAAEDPPRGALADHLHPLYRPLLEEFYTDGRSYVSADGTQRYPADTFSPTIREAIRLNVPCGLFRLLDIELAEPL